jgi:hypothetical protein
MPSALPRAVECWGQAGARPSQYTESPQSEFRVQSRHPSREHTQVSDKGEANLDLLLRSADRIDVTLIKDHIAYAKLSRENIG